MTIEGLRQLALEILNDDDAIFTDCVNELDSWNSFADGFRCWDMCEFDCFYSDIKPSDLLNLVCDDFSINDDYFYEDSYGLHSTDSICEVYRDCTTSEDVLDALIEYYDRIEIYSTCLDEVVEKIVNFSESSDGWVDEE